MNWMEMTVIVHINLLQMKNSEMHQVWIHYLLKILSFQTKRWHQKQNIHKNNPEKSHLDMKCM